MEVVARVTRKSPDQLASMRKAGKIVAETLALLTEAIRPGVTTAYLDKLAEEFIRSREAIPSFKGYRGFPASICTSPNDVVVHGIPGDYRLVEGDIIGIDCGAIYEGMHGDAAVTVGVGEISLEAVRLIETTKRALEAGIEVCVPGNTLGDIGHAVESIVEAEGFSVVRDYVGHGIGEQMHEPPQIPNYGVPGEGKKIKVGHVFAIEPMVNIGTHLTKVLEDGWTVVTADGSLSAHFEHTVAVLENGPEVLTRI
ncbi:MAG: type I methionyl aminopeptidase [Acidimicrobiia bacterium]